MTYQVGDLITLVRNDVKLIGEIIAIENGIATVRHEYGIAYEDLIRRKRQ